MCLALGLCGAADSISKDGKGRRLPALCRKHVARSGALQGVATDGNVTQGADEEGSACGGR